jgi:Protein of unknown function (DUF998)
MNANDTHHSTTATAAIIGFAVAAAAIGVADALNPQWDWVADLASYYVHGRGGWLVTAGLAVIGAGSLGLAVAVPPVRGRWPLVGWSLAVLVGAVFPADPPGQWDRPPTLAGAVHGLAGLTAFVLLPVAAGLLAVGLPRRPEWRAYRTRLRAMAALVLLASVPFWVTLVDVMGGPSLALGGHPSVVGLAERVLLLAGLGWLATLALAVRTVPR